jgi:hypothetical protein
MQFHPYCRIAICCPAYERVHWVVARDRSGIVGMCHVQFRSLSALQPPKTSPHRARKGILTPPSWWTSERKTKTVCAIHCRSAGPLFLNLPLSPGSYVADAEAFEPSKAVTRSGSTPMVGSLMHGSFTNARFATKPGTARFLNAGMFAISIPPCSKHCSATIPIGFEGRRLISKLSGAALRESMSFRNSRFERNCCAMLPIGTIWTSSSRFRSRPARAWIACLHRSWEFHARS